MPADLGGGQQPLSFRELADICRTGRSAGALAQALEKAVPGAGAARPPAEAAISEGNLTENPIFVLSNKDAKPRDKSAYVKVIHLGTVIDGNRAVERAIKLSASTEYGYPTTFAYRILLALIDLARRDGLQSPTVHTSRHQLAKRGPTTARAVR